ncbi:hypothetical protein [Primorskyibacter sp. S187A]|uniref:hypothetical protein n=1 Tax=Primorskyibacter sp. S187A TaxID=3415130 RepID=UPI003C79B665
MADPKHPGPMKPNMAPKRATGMALKSVAPVSEASGAVAEGPKGPLKLVRKSEFEWAYEARAEHSLTDDQSWLVAEITGLLNQMYEFRDQDGTKRLMERLADTFAATLDDGYDGDLEPHIQQVEKTRHEFFRRCVKPAHRRRLNWPIFMTVAVLVGFMFLGGTAGSTLSKSIIGFLGTPEETTPFFFMIAGVLVGRLIYFGMAHGEKITSLEMYFALERELSSPIVTLLFDIITGFVACLLFVTGIIVISLGGGENSGDAAISTLHVIDNPMLAIAFGVLVGVAKAQFLKKMVGLATERVG